MKPSGIRLLCACVALLASACTSTTGSSNSGSGAGSGDDGGSGASTPVACTYLVTTVSGCEGNDTSSSRVVCVDEPCSGLPSDPPPTSVGDCYGYTESSDETELHETCAQWQDGGGTSGSCPMNVSSGNAACDSCIRASCASAWCACASGADVDDAGLPECFDYYDCVATCMSGSGSPSLSTCRGKCSPAYQGADRSAGDALLSCVIASCDTTSTCG